MTFLEIEAFLAIAETGSITRAAERLFVSQSTLSGRIQTLEYEIGEVLFSRGRGVRNTELTAKGEDFIIVAEKWKKLWQETKTIMQKESNKVLKISALHSINAYIIAMAYPHFSLRNNDVRLLLRARHSVESYNLVESTEVSAAFIGKPQYSKKFQTTPLFKEELVFICGGNSSYGNTVSPKDLSVDNEIFMEWESDFIQWHDYWFGGNTSPRVCTDDIAWMEWFIEKDNMWSIVPLSTWNALKDTKYIRKCKLHDAPAPRTVSLLAHSSADRPAILQELLDSIKTITDAQGIQWLL